MTNRKFLTSYALVEICFGNDQSAYDEGWAREDLVGFCHGLLQLAEAFYVIYKNHNRKFQHKLEQKLSKEAIKALQEINQPVLLTEEEIANPVTVVQRFCDTFSHDYYKSRNAGFVGGGYYL